MRPGTSADEGKRVAIVQSCYVPWKGYFDLINLVDEFILFDDRQYTRRDWRNRNRIKTPQGSQWLTIPVEVKGRYHQRIDETRISDAKWSDKHWKTLTHNYGTAPHFEEYREPVEDLYRRATAPLLSQVNRLFIDGICRLFEIETAITWSTRYEVEGTRTERLVSLCQAAGAKRYLSGPSARDYLDEQLFEEAGIALDYVDYSGYSEYPQVHPPFDHNVTILDLIFNTGKSRWQYMKSFQPTALRVNG
jgi:WbqC-like protein family